MADLINGKSTGRTGFGAHKNLEVRSGAMASAASVAATVAAPKYEMFDDFDAPVEGGALSYKTTDLLGQAYASKAEADIPYDEMAYTFDVSLLPAQIGKQIVLSVPNGNLKVQYASQAGDVPGATEVTCPAGKHDLVPKISVDLSTNFKKSFRVSFPTVQRFADEYFHGNSGGASGNRDVSYIFQPHEFNMGKTSVTIINRQISPSMKRFLEFYPGQTAETIAEYRVPLKRDGKYLMRYGNKPGQSSCVAMWYDNMINASTPTGKNLPLQANAEGYAAIPADIYEACETKAISEISRYISLGDVTSENFCIVIDAYPNSVGMGDYEAQYRGYSPDLKVLDSLTGDRLAAAELHARTPIVFSGRVVIPYKKIHTGDQN